MADQPREIRNAAKALIIRDRNLLVIAKRDTYGFWYILPGGGQKHGETLEQALIRECWEEIGTQITIGKLLFVREFIGINHADNTTQNNDWVRTFHSVDFIFTCQIAEEYIPQNGHHPDDGQQEVVWLPITSIQEYRLFPSPLKEIIQDELIHLNHNFNVYLGDVN